MKNDYKSIPLAWFSTCSTTRCIFCWLFSAILFCSATVDAEVATPVLKWQYGGCYNSWCETGWYSSPAVADIDNDGILDVVASAYSIAALKGTTGEVIWRAKSGHDISSPDAANVGRTWPSILVQDINNDGVEEIVTAHGSGWVSAYDLTGTFLPGWPKRPSTSELRGLMVADLDGDDSAEIVVSAAIGSRMNTWVYEHSGTLRSGWPQLVAESDAGYSWGIFNDNVAAGDLDDDGLMELIVPSDVHYICGYEPDGTQVPSNYSDGEGGFKSWGQVGIWEDLTVELRGWGRCDGVRAESYRTNFAYGAAVVDDVNNDQVPEIIVTGNVYDCDAGYPPSRYIGLYIFNADRSRFNTDGFNWNTVPVDTGAPLAGGESYSIIENTHPNPVVVDLDGDGNKEILFTSYDGRMHAYWLDKTEHHNWPYSVHNASEGFKRFASEPVVADLDNDGFAEVLFGSWTQKGSNRNGKLHILDYQGNVIHEFDLPQKKSSSSSITWNGSLAAPVLADIDADDDLEIIFNTAYSGFVAYDLPGSSAARVLWKTGRAGRIWQKPSLTDEELLENVVKILQTLAGEEAADYPDPNKNGKTDMADALLYLKQVGD